MRNLKESFTTNAINIKTYPLSDYDNVVVMFSREYGLIKGIARGVKRPKSKLGARMQTLVANKLMLKGGRTFDTICEAQALNTFNKLRQDLDKLAYSLYLSELINSFCQDGDEDSENNAQIYDLFYCALEGLANCENKTQIFLNVIKFQLQFMTQIGYGVEFEHCLKCSCKINEEAYFSISNCGVVCAECRSQNQGYTKLHRKIREFLQAQNKCKINEKSSYDLLVDENFCEKCFLFLKKYINSLSSRPARAINVLEKLNA